MELLTIGETARLLRLSEITVRRHIAAGRLPAVRIGRRIRVRRDALPASLPEAVPASTVTPPGIPLTPDSPLWELVGLGCSDEPSDIAQHKHEYLADAFGERGG